MKRKLSICNIITGVLWVVSLVIFAAGTVIFGGPQKSALEKAQLNVLESRDRLALAQNAQNEETKQQIGNRLSRMKTSLDAFSCAASTESSLIFKVGQLAETIKLENFTTRLPDSTPPKTMEDNKRIGEGWLMTEFVSDFLQLAAFINALERHEPLLFVESIEVRRHEQDTRKVSARLMLSYLIRKEDTANPVAIAGPAVRNDIQ